MKKQLTGRSTAEERRARPLTDKERAQLKRLKEMPDSEVDLSDIPLLPPGKWASAVVGKFYRPIKKGVYLRVDADVLAWLQSQGPGYQSRINTILREAMGRAAETR